MLAKGSFLVIGTNNGTMVVLPAMRESIGVIHRSGNSIGQHAHRYVSFGLATVYGSF